MTPNGDAGFANPWRRLARRGNIFFADILDFLCGKAISKLGLSLNKSISLYSTDISSGDFRPYEELPAFVKP